MHSVFQLTARYHCQSIVTIRLEYKIVFRDWLVIIVIFCIIFLTDVSQTHRGLHTIGWTVRLSISPGIYYRSLIGSHEMAYR